MQYEQDSEGYIQVTKVNESVYDGRIDAYMYENSADVGDFTKAVQKFTNVEDDEMAFTVYRDDINPTGESTTMSKSYFVQVCKTGSTTECETTEMVFDTYHTEDVPPVTIDPYCVGDSKGTQKLYLLVLKYKDGDKYSWQDESGKKLSQSDFLTLYMTGLSAGDHIYKLQNRKGTCYSPGIEIKVSVLSNDAPKLSKTFVTYTGEYVVDGNYTKTVSELAGEALVENTYDCDITWYDKAGNKIDNFESYIPPVPEQTGTTIDEYKVTKDCGCNTEVKPSSFYIMRYVVAKPTVEDLEFCINDTRAANGFDVIIGQSLDAGESPNNYSLEFSENADMSGAVSLAAGESHFNYTFDVSAVGTKTYYVRQKELSSDQYSEIVSFDVVVKQPTKPTLTDKSICANTTTSVSLSSISSETNLIWTDKNDAAITGSIATVKRGDITVKAQKYEMVDGVQCLSEVATATISVDSLGVSISGDTKLFSGETGRAEVAIVGDVNTTVDWSSDVANSIIGDVDKSQLNVVMDNSDITLTANVTNGACSKSVDWTIEIDLYQCPKPIIDDIAFCINDSRAANGFDVIIGQTTDAGETPNNYILEFSENSDMSNSVSLAAGETHFNYTFNVATVGTKTYYVRQKNISNGRLSKIVSFEVAVKQPTKPVLTNKNICLNSSKSVDLSSICSESNLIWKDWNDAVVTGSVSVEKRGDYTVSAQKYETINGVQCLSVVATATIHADSLGVSISGDNILLPDQTGKAEVDVKSSGNATIVWSSNVTGSIIGDVNKSQVNVQMGSTNITLTADVTDGVCSQSVNWTIQADLFQCPAPTADDINLCINDPRAADGFDANITLEDNSDSKSNYVLSVSKNSDMSGATTLAAGATHFAYTFDASKVGNQTIYIQQTEQSRNLSSAIIPVKVIVSQPAVPSVSSKSICLNDETEVQLSQLSSNANLQWYDVDKNELTTTARFSKRGSHTLYVKRYELVNGAKCWSELTSTNVTADSIGIKIIGDNHLCPNASGSVTVEGTGTSMDNIQWSSDVTNTLSNVNSSTAGVKIGDGDLNLTCSVSAGVCSISESWQITVGTGKVSGQIKFTEGDKVRESNTLENVEFSSCGGKVSVEATIEHTSSDFTVKKGAANIGTYSFDGNVAKFEIEGAGTYSLVYENDCETSFSFKVTEMEILPTVETTKWSSCYGGYISAEISNVDGCKVVWKRDGTEVAKDTKTLKINNVSADNIGDYTYELVCDGCPSSGVVSANKPDIYSPLTVSVTQSADTICQGDDFDVELQISPNSDKVSYVWPNGDEVSTYNSGASATITPYVTKHFSVTIKNGDCAQQTKQVYIYVQHQMVGNIESGIIMCEGDSMELDASSLEAERYEWTHTDSDSSIITVVPNDVENRYVLTAYRGKCVLEKEFILKVGATPKLASIDSIGLDDVQINMSSVGEYQYVVDGDKKAEDITDNVKMNIGFGNHTLSIIDIAGCQTDTTFSIVAPPLEFQKFITPSADGEASAFRIPDALIVYESVEMNIYDRWGKKIVTLTSSDSEGWDGTYNGKNMPSGDYWYDLSIDELDKTYVGHFTLVRE